MTFDCRVYDFPGVHVALIMSPTSGCFSAMRRNSTTRHTAQVFTWAPYAIRFVYGRFPMGGVCSEFRRGVSVKST
jgi:hypothetical protein